MKLIVLLILCGASYSPVARSDFDWMATTLDNDIFIGSDDGYTNGVYLSLFDVEELTAEKVVKPHFWMYPLMWSMRSDSAHLVVNSYTVGQTMSTPSDITIEDPSEDELPYSALLAITNSYTYIGSNFADQVAITIGIIGPSAFGAEAQKYVHKIVGSDEPLGWDTQLHDEIVFQFSRARAWRSWTSKSGRTDLTTSSRVGIGTLHSAAHLDSTLRYGRDLTGTIAPTLYTNSRTANPSAVNGSWFLYAGINGGYVFNQIFTDGNTYRDSRSVDYQHEYIGVTAGLTYSWEHTSLSFAYSNANIVQSKQNDETLNNITQFGTVTFARKL